MYYKARKIIAILIVFTITSLAVGNYISMKIKQQKFQRIVNNKLDRIENYTSKLNMIDLKTLQPKIDVSMMDSVECKFTSKLAGIWLISYAANGEVNFANQRALTCSAINKCIDFIKPYNDKHLDKDFAKANAEILKMPRGAGYWLWKPYIILKTLNEVPENDIIIYLDSGVSIKHKVDSLINHFNEENKDIMIYDLDSFFSTRKYTKRELLKIMNMDNDTVGHTSQKQASYIILKNTPNARKIIQEWLSISTNKDAITDSPSSIAEYPEFVDHRHDQSILNLLAIKYAKNFKILKALEGDKYFYHHRRRSKEQGPVYMFAG